MLFTFASTKLTETAFPVPAGGENNNSQRTLAHEVVKRKGMLEENW